jgi:SAM-dependent methyltransferase
MQRWGGGYVTDIEYTEDFYAAQAPHTMALTAAVHGFEPPDLTRRFAYCELGCGKGTTSLILAASYPHAEFHAVDFNPSHIAHAEALAHAARLENVSFHERSFEDLMRPDMPALPMFDMVTLHGVWTWVAPSVQQAILDFLNRRVKPRGLVYLSYNAMPASSVRAPLQRLLRELAALWPGRSDHAAENAVAMLGRLADAKIIPAAFHDGLKRMTERPNSPSYLAHEYLNEHWQPAYHADVARAFAEAKLTYGGSTVLLRNFVNLGVTAEQRKLLGEIPIVELRETLRDYCLDNAFRQDVFARGARRMSEARRDSVIGAVRLNLARPVPELIEIVGPTETVWRPDPEAYGLFLKALKTRPHTVAELISLPGPAAGHSVTPTELVGVLVGTGLAAVWTESGPEAQSACERFNRLLEAEGEIPLFRSTTLAVACLRAGLTLSAADFDLYMALKRGEPPDPHKLAVRFVKRCKEEGGFPIIDGKPVEDESEAHVAVTRDYATKLERIVPIWRLIGIVP